MIDGSTTGTVNEAVARALVRGFIAQGAKHAVVSPGSRNTPILLALVAANIEVHVILDERAAGFFALGLSKATGLPTLLSCTSGSAGANYLPGIVEANHGCHGLVVITADRPQELQGRGAPQTMNQKELFGTYVSRFEHLDAVRETGTEREIQETAEELFNEAFDHRSPVHLNVSFQEPLWSGIAMTPDTIPSRQRDAVGALEVNLEGLPLLQSRRGLFVCGPDTVADQSERELILATAARLGWPVLAEASSGVRFGAAHGNLITTYDALMRSDGANELSPDVVIRFGKTNTSRALNEWLARVACGRVILVDPAAVPYDPDRLAVTHRRVSAVDFCRSIDAEFKLDRRDKEWLPVWERCEALLRGLILRTIASGWSEGRVAQLVLDALPEGGALHLANSMPIRDVDSFCPAGGRTLRVFTNRGVNGIDGTIATTAGEAHGVDDAPMLLLTGDLAFLHDASSVPLAESRPMTIVVVDNGGGGIFGFLPISRHPTEFDRLFLTKQTADPGTIAEAYGARVVRVSDAPSLSAALAAEVERDGVGVIVATVSRQENIACHQELWQDASIALEAIL